MGDKVYSPYPAYKVEGKSNLRPALMLALRNWPWFVFSVLIMFAVFGIYLHYQPPVYKVHASLLLKSRVQKNELSNSSAIIGSSQINTNNSKPIEDEIGILTSYTLMDRVVKTLGLDVRYFRSVNGLQREFYSGSPIRVEIEKGNSNLYTNDLHISFSGSDKVIINEKIYPVNQPLNTDYGRLRIIPIRTLSDTTEPVTISVSSRPRTVKTYLAKLEVTPVLKQSGLLTIDLIDAVPSKGEAILDQLIKEYVKEDLAHRNQEINKLLRLIEDRLELIAGWTKSISGKEILKNSSPDEELEALSFSALGREPESLNQIDEELNGLNVIEQYAGNRAHKGQLEQAALTLSDPTLISLVEQALSLEAKRKKKENKAIEESIVIRELKFIKYKLYKSLQSIRRQLNHNRDELIVQNRRVDNFNDIITDKGAALRNILSQPEIRNNLYSYLLQKREEAVMSALSTAAESRIVDLPRSEEIPLTPVNVTVFVLLACSGLAVPLLFIGVKNAFNNRITRRTEVEERTNVPILGEIALSQQITIDNLVFRPRLQSVMGEQIRALRTNLQYVGDAPLRNKVILFTSCLSGEGKSLISLNLGASLALVGRKTIILEMDMRRPRLHKGLHLENRTGISNYLMGEASIEDIVQPIAGFNNYFIATAGPLPGNPAELLSSDRLSQLIHELKKEFDHIVVDSPPIGLVTDSQLIAPLTDITLFIVRHNYTPKHCMKMINNLYNGNRFPNLNLVLNAVGEGDIRYSTYYDGDYTLNPV